MTRRPWPVLLFAWLALAIAPASCAFAAELTYTLYALGVPIADATLGGDLAPDSYRMALTYRTVGLAELAFGGRLEQHAHGMFAGERTQPKMFSSKARIRGQDRIVSLAYRNDTPLIDAIAPPPESEREDVPMPMRAHTMDPLSKIAALLRRIATTGRCDGDARDFDGRRLELFEVRTMREDMLPASARSSFAGRALRCDFTSQILAGFRLGHDRAEDARPHRGTIWLAPIAAGAPRWPVRAEIETRWFGTAGIFLTGAAP